MESITGQSECESEQWQLVFFSYQGHLLLQLIQVPVLLLLPSILGTTLEGETRERDRERTTHQARRLSSRTSAGTKWGESHMLVDTMCLAIYIHSHVLQRQGEHNGLCVHWFISISWHYWQNHLPNMEENFYFIYSFFFLRASSSFV